MIAPLERLATNPLVGPDQIPYARASGAFNPGVAVDRSSGDVVLLVRVFEEETREILAENDSPDVPFRWSVNPYRGCYHGCAYCYARPSHELLGFGAGTDFERKIVVKRKAPELLRKAFERASPSWKGEQ